MHPVLLQIGPLTVFSYAAMVVSGFLLATWTASHVARRWPLGPAPLSPSRIVDFNCLVMLGGIIGARLFFIEQNWEVYRRYPFEVVALWHGGLIWYGGFIGGLVTAAVYLRVQRIPLLPAMDQIAPFVSLGHSVGRIGCFLHGCCYGRPTSAWYGMAFPRTGQVVIPTQLLEALVLLVLYVLLRQCQRPRDLASPGRVFSLYLMGYAVMRFFVEFLRGGQAIFWVGLTLQQVLCLAAFSVGLSLWLACRNPAAKEP